MTEENTIVEENVSSGPRAAQRSATIGLVAFLFAVAGTEELPGVVLVALLGDFGIGPAAARQQLGRMRSDGQLASVRRGRNAIFRLDGAFRQQFEHVRRPAPPPAWTGRFHALLYQVPEARRGYRDRLRRHATFAGYGILQPGVLIGVRDRWAQVAAAAGEPPDGAHVRAVELGMSTPAAIEAAAVAWELPALAEVFTGHLPALRAAAADPAVPAADASALLRLAGLTNRPAIDLIGDPGLPAVLHPPHWPGTDLRAALEAVFTRYVPACHRYVAGLVDAACS